MFLGVFVFLGVEIFFSLCPKKKADAKKGRIAVGAPKGYRAKSTCRGETLEEGQLYIRNENNYASKLAGLVRAVGDELRNKSREITNCVEQNI